MINLLVKDVDNEIVRENFRRVQKELTETQVILKGNWKYFKLTFTGAVTNLKIAHGFNFIPTDVIQTSTSGVGFIQWNYDSFDRTYLDISTSDACVIRAFVGRYEESAGEL